MRQPLQCEAQTAAVPVKGVQGGSSATSSDASEQGQAEQQHPLDAVVQAEQARATAEQLAADLRADNAALRESLLEMTQAYDEVRVHSKCMCCPLLTARAVFL